jgi:alkylhydroperoxidase/carboxymuconolactone decarboxylase family protein YurZ
MGRRVAGRSRCWRGSPWRDPARQLPNHIRTALRVGATKEEVLEVILQSAIYAGMPKMIEAMRVYRDLMKDLGLLEVEELSFRGDARE